MSSLPAWYFKLRALGMYHDDLNWLKEQFRLYPGLTFEQAWYMCQRPETLTWICRTLHPDLGRRAREAFDKPTRWLEHLRADIPVEDVIKALNGWGEL